MGAVPPRLPGQDNSFSLAGFLLAAAIVLVLAVPASFMARVLVELVYPGRWPT